LQEGLDCLDGAISQLDSPQSFVTLSPEDMVI